MSNDHSRAVASADAEIKYRGGAAEPETGSKSTEYTGPLCPMSFRVVDPPFSFCFRRLATNAMISNDAFRVRL